MQIGCTTASGGAAAKLVEINLTEYARNVKAVSYTYTYTYLLDYLGSLFITELKLSEGLVYSHPSYLYNKTILPKIFIIICEQNAEIKNLY